MILEECEQKGLRSGCHHSLSFKCLVLDQGLINNSKSINLLNTIHLRSPVGNTHIKTDSPAHFGQGLSNPWMRKGLALIRQVFRKSDFPSLPWGQYQPQVTVWWQTTLIFQHKAPWYLCPPKPRQDQLTILAISRAEQEELVLPLKFPFFPLQASFPKKGMRQHQPRPQSDSLWLCSS